MTRQILRTYQDIRQSVTSTEQFVEDYDAVKEDLAKAQISLTEAIVSLSPLFGTGSPEGVITSNNSMVYFDTTNSPTDVTQYFNDTVGINTNWVQVV